MIKKIHKTEEEWKKLLTPEQYAIMRGKQTERPFTCELKEFKGAGIYRCAACDLALFKTSAKFESGTGWPSFYEPVTSDCLVFRNDRSLVMIRTEVLCARCDSHLGHVFDDGPLPSNRRYCINGVALTF
ncbi:MAG TPA: peptide-methionine (R)-S-oxide reductase MsrB [Candidatus Paceibacterota bacterium]